MRRGARDSQIVNNFFTFATIVIVSITLTIYNKYIVKEDSTERLNSKLPCQLEVKTIDKISNPDLLKHSLALLSKGHYIIDGGIITLLDSKSELTKKINIEDVTNIFLNSIGINSTNDIQRFLKIKYEIIESEKQSSSAGKLLTSFRLQNKEVFRVSTVFETYNINEIKKRVLCTMKAFKYNATK